MPNAVANSAASEFFTHGTIDEDSPTVYNMVTLKTVCGTYHEFGNCNKSSGVNSAMHQEFHHVLIIHFEQLSLYLSIRV